MLPVKVCPTDGVPAGAYNAHLRWETDSIVDTEETWEMTIFLADDAPEPTCKVDLTPRRLQTFKTPEKGKFNFEVTGVKDEVVLARGMVVADQYDLVTLEQIPILKDKVRVKLSTLK